MLIEKRKFLFFTSARIILDDEQLNRAFREKKYHYITGLSYQKFDFGDKIIVKHKRTILIDLTRPLEEIFRQFHHTTRNEIRRTFRMPEFSFTADDANCKEARALYADFEQFQKRHFSFPQSLSDHRLFCAYEDHKLIAVVLCYDVPPVLRARAIFSRRHKARSREERNHISYAARRLIYSVCQWGRDRDYATFDLGAINTTDPTKASITAFKRGFGGREVDEYTYTYRRLF